MYLRLGSCRTWNSEVCSISSTEAFTLLGQDRKTSTPMLQTKRAHLHSIPKTKAPYKHHKAASHAPKNAKVNCYTRQDRKYSQTSPYDRPEPFLLALTPSNSLTRLFCSFLLFPHCLDNFFVLFRNRTVSPSVRRVGLLSRISRVGVMPISSMRRRSC